VMNASMNPKLPKLDMRIYCTRAKKGDVEAPLRTGRPNFKELMDEIVIGKKVPALVFACGPGMMVNGLWDECNSRSKWKSNTTTRRLSFKKIEAMP